MNEHGASQVRLVAGPAQQMQETWVQCPGRGDPLAQEVATMPVFLPGKPYGQKNLWWARVLGVAKSWTQLRD